MLCKRQDDKFVELMITTKDDKDIGFEYYIMNTRSILTNELIEAHVLEVKFFKDKYKCTRFYGIRLTKKYYIQYDKNNVEIHRYFAKTYEPMLKKMKIMYNKKYN